MKAIILAGGSGTRLWPLSRKNFPKQFLNITGASSLLQQTAARLLKTLSLDDIVVMTNDAYRFYVKKDMDSLADGKRRRSFENIILEPESRNTAPAIALGIAYCRDKLGCKEDEALFVCPSDHIISPADRFAAYMRDAEEIARNGLLLTFGVSPDRPETGYGYIKKGQAQKTFSGVEYFNVAEFAEKPDLETAKTYLGGGYLWNSGMFAFTIGSMDNELRKHAPEIGAALDMTFDEISANFSKMPDISIDYAVMEKSSRVATMPLDLQWNDIGSWDAIYDVLEKNGDGNISVGDIKMIDTKNCLILGDKRLVATIGLEDCLVVETADALLVSKKGEAQKVKNIVNQLKTEKRPEADEHLTCYRPWGSYTVLEEGPRYKIKRIVVNPGAKLSMQMHYHRAEHWVVVTGAAKVTIEGKEKILHENESVYVPKSALHRLENPGKTPLEIIEVQSGEYVGEDDIVRVEDTYGRKTGME